MIGLALILTYSSLNHFLSSLRPNDFNVVGVIATLLIMAFLFADYAFTYTASNLARLPERILDHVITGIIMFGTGALLEISILALNLALERNFIFLGFIAILFYVSLVLYDFWDLNRALNNY